jgi:alkanesulfonate monooxygenase SsuD/methylene tetrahydromethanopterin reductase-like flavin-dependent oxidoreductase (luciferase family)
VIVSAEPSTALELGVIAEKSGFTNLWVPDHFTDVDGDRLEPWTILSALAPMTKTILLGSGVTDTQRSHPARTAHAVASLDVLSKGRAVLGIGAGEAMNVKPFGLPWGSPAERVARLAEAIRVIRMLWSGSRETPVDFDGGYFQLHKAFLSQRPKQKLPKIYVGVFSSREGLQVVGRLGDGWYPWMNTPATFKRRWSVIADAARSAGRDIKKIDRASHVMVAFPQNSEERQDALLAGKLTLLMERSTLISMKYKLESRLEQYQKLSVLPDDIRRLKEEAVSIPDDLVYQTMEVGGREEAVSLIEEFGGAGVKSFSIVDLLSPKTDRRTMGVFRKIIKHFS